MTTEEKLTNDEVLYLRKMIESMRIFENEIHCTIRNSEGEVFKLNMAQLEIQKEKCSN
jgi:hypothetical protein